VASAEGAIGAVDAGASAGAGETSGGAVLVVARCAEAGPKTSKDAEIAKANAAAPRIFDLPNSRQQNVPPHENEAATVTSQRNRAANATQPALTLLWKRLADEDQLWRTI
jgi:hypothetical protein